MSGMNGMTAKPRYNMPNLEHGLMTPAKRIRNCLKAITYFQEKLGTEPDNMEAGLLKKNLESQKQQLEYLNRLEQSEIQYEEERKARVDTRIGELVRLAVNQ